VFKTRIVAQAYEYWLSKARTGRLPRRLDIKPEEIRHLLPYVFLVDVMMAPACFRYRLVGTSIEQWAGQDYTGVTLDARIHGPNWQRVLDDYRIVAHTRVPRHTEHEAPWQSREFFRYERIVAPLSSDGTTVDMLFGALHVLDQSS